MGRTRLKAKGRKENGTYWILPSSVSDSNNFRRLSAHTIKLLVDLGSQYSGYNNGDLCAAWKLMEVRNWKSRDTLANSIREALHYRMIVITQLGDRRKPTLYAFTWFDIHKATDQIEVNEGERAPNFWRESVSDYQRPIRGKKQIASTVGDTISTATVSNNYKSLKKVG
jgi:hypothetical protein